MEVKIILFTSLTLLLAGFDNSIAGFSESQNLDVASILTNSYWPEHYLGTTNSNHTNDRSSGCKFCEEAFYHEPPPDDIIYIPSPPVHPSLQNALLGNGLGKQRTGEQCSFCHVLYDESEQFANLNKINNSFSSGYLVGVGSFIAIVAVVFLYMAGLRKPRIIPSFARTAVLKSTNLSNGLHNHPQHHNQLNKSNPLADTLPHSVANMTDPCYIQANRDKNRTSPIINDHVSHKKTAIPSKCWAQPGSIVDRTVRRIPNEYEIPSSRTNSTGASSAIYADAAHDPLTNARLFSPYNIHTYAEVREVLDQNEHFHTSSNSSAMLSESNYDNAMHQQQTSMQVVPNGTVQMSDFNSMRLSQSVAYQPLLLHHHQILNHASHQSMPKASNGQPIYEQPQQHAQIIITSNNQGVNPVILNHRDRIHNVI